MAKSLQYSGIRGYTDYTGKIDKSFNEVAQGSVTRVWRGDIFLEFSEELFEEKLEQTLEVCVKNTKEYIKEIDLIDTGDLHDSIRYWEPRREGTRLVGAYGVPTEYNDHDMDYGLYQEIGFTHVNDGWVQNEFLINGLQKSRAEIQAIWSTSGTLTTGTFDGGL